MSVTVSECTDLRLRMMTVEMCFSLMQLLHSKLTEITLKDGDMSCLFCLQMRKQKGKGEVLYEQSIISLIWIKAVITKVGKK